MVVYATTNIQFNSIQDYLYSAFYETIVAKQLYRKFSFYNTIYILQKHNIFNLWENLVNLISFWYQIWKIKQKI